MAENNDQNLNNLLKARLALLDSLKKANQDYANIVSDITKSETERDTALKGQSEKVAKLRKQFAGVNTAIKEINEETSELLKGFSAAGDSISSLSGLQEEFKNSLTKTSLEGVKLSREIRSIGGESKEQYKKALIDASDLVGTIAELANLNKEDGLEIASKNEEYATKFDELYGISKALTEAAKTGTDEDKERAKALASIVGKLEDANKEAAKYYNIDKEHAAFLKEINEDYENVSKGLKKVTYTIETMLGSTKGAIGMSLIGAGLLVEKFHEVGREMGFGITQYKAFTGQVLLAGLLSEQSAEAVKDLGRELGDVREVTFGVAADAATMAYHFNLSGEQTAFLMHAFGDLQGLSYQTGKNTLAYADNLALANGLMPGEMMKEIAENTEFFAKFSRDGGKNIADAALAAGKLGVNLSTVDKVADHLLDYQTSIADEMDASVLLGRQLDLSRARELMYQGKVNEGMKAALDAAGGINAFNEMDYYQRQAVAKALGVGVDELQKMSAHQQALNGQLGLGEQISASTSDWWQTIVGSVAGKGLAALGGWVMTGSQFAANISLIKQGMPGLLKPFSMIGNLIGAGIKKLITFIGLQKSLETSVKLSTSASLANNLMPFTPPVGGGKSARAFRGGRKAAQAAAAANAATTATTTATESVATTATAASKAAPGTSILSKFGSTGQIFALAGAMLAFGAAMMMVASAFEKFGAVTNMGQALGLFAAGLLGMGIAILGLSYALAPLAATGILELVAVSMLAFGAAVLMTGEGFNLMANGIATIASVLPTLSEHFLTLVGLAIPILTLAGAFGILAGSLTMLSMAGLSALPVLGILGGIGLGIAALSGFMSGGGAEGEKGKTDMGDVLNTLVTEVQGLRGDLTSGKVAVFLDGKKVNTALALNQKVNKF